MRGNTSLQGRGGWAIGVPLGGAGPWDPEDRGEKRRERRSSEDSVAGRCPLGGSCSGKTPMFSHFRTGLSGWHGVQGVCVPLRQNLPEPARPRSVSAAMRGRLQLPW